MRSREYVWIKYKVSLKFYKIVKARYRAWKRLNKKWKKEYDLDVL